MKKLLKKLAGLDRKKSIDLREEEIDEETEEEEEDLYEEEEQEETADDGDDELDEEDKEWMKNHEYEEGQLSIDVYQTPENIIVKSTIAGVKSPDIDISINNDMLTIRGKREMYEDVQDDDYLFRECYWGSFSRSLILPMEVEADKIEASLENGVLTITLPKAQTAKQISIKVKEK